MAGCQLAPGVITVDTSALFARLNYRDPERDRVVRAMAKELGPWIVPAAILGEVGYLIEQRGTPAALDAFLEDLADATYQLDIGTTDVARVQTLSAVTVICRSDWSTHS